MTRLFFININCTIVLIEIVMATNHNPLRTSRLIYKQRTKLGGTATRLAPTRNEFFIFCRGDFNLLNNLKNKNIWKTK